MGMVVLPNDALLVVDVQNDFCPGGALAVKEGDEIVPRINSLQERFQNIIFTRDWHPQNHCSFSDNPEFRDMSWPVHCVQFSEGAAFHPDLQIPVHAIVISKGSNPDREAYSGFDGTDLHHVLREKNVGRVFVCGLATDYCVRHTVLDAVRNDYEAVLLEDLVRGVDPCTSGEALAEMKDAGAQFARSGDLA